jgi:pimeloyl-ACP methyl ester carboxylesterase
MNKPLPTTLPMQKNRKHIFSIGLIALVVVGYFIADTILFNGIKPKPIYKAGFIANCYAKENGKSKTAVILIGGGPWGDYWAQEFVRNDMVGLSIPYSGQEGLPRLPEEIDLAYFEKAINWLKERTEVDPNKIIVMGASRNAELALIIASTFPESVSGVVAYAPSSVSWSNTVLPYNSDALKPSWKYKDIDIPYVPMEKITGSESNSIDLMAYWVSGLTKTDFVE